MEYFENKGKGVVTTNPFAKGDFDLVIKHYSKVISPKEADEIQNHTYIHHLKIKDKKYCIKAQKITAVLAAR